MIITIFKRRYVTFNKHFIKKLYLFIQNGRIYIICVNITNRVKHKIQPVAYHCVKLDTNEATSTNAFGNLVVYLSSVLYYRDTIESVNTDITS